VFLIIEAGKDRGVWAKHGLNPEFIYTRSDWDFVTGSKNLTESGVKIGFSVPENALQARSNGVRIKIVSGHLGLTPSALFVKGESAIKTIEDLNGKKIGVASKANVYYRYASFLVTKFGIKPEFVFDPSLLDLGGAVAALKTGRIDAFVTARGAAYRLVDSGELRVVVHMRDIWPKPWVTNVIWATDDLIQQNPDLVNRFVKATLETVKYLEENPSYAADVYVKRTNAPKDLADKVVSQLEWSSNGLGSGQDLRSAVSNRWQFHKETGAIPPSANVNIEDAVDIRFLP
ncbi:MAG: ABC transporter substrate-binding protein, partial [Thaumarchaeota archaeon]|nr:ABC transporter substrate-binding protein [Nitrososphaerota archaeon]